MSILGAAVRAAEELFSGPNVRTVRKQGLEKMAEPPEVQPNVAIPGQAPAEGVPAPDPVPVPEVPPIAPATPDFGQGMPSNLNRNYLETTDAVKNYMDDLQGVYGGFKDQRRGVRTHETTKEAAGSTQVRDEVSRLIGGVPGAAWNAEQLVSGRQLLLRSSEELQSLSSKVSAGQATAEDMDDFLRLHQSTVALQRAVQGGIAEAGRALNAMQIKAAPSSKERIQQLQNTLVTAGGQRNIMDLANAYQGLTDPADILDQTRKLESATRRWGKALQESWINSILSGPATHIVNVIGNVGAQMYETALVKPVTAGVGLARQTGASVAGVNAAERLYASEIVPESIGKFQGFMDTFIAMGRERLDYFNNIDLDQTNKLDIDQGSISAANLAPGLDPQGLTARGVNATGSVLRVPGTMLSIGDDLFKNVLYRGELNALAYRQAVSENGVVMTRFSELMSNPSREMHAQAMEQSKKLTFTEGQADKSGMIAKLATGIQSFAAEYPSIKYVVPFVRTPANLIQYFTENSVLGPVTEKWREEFMAGGVRRDAAVARWVVAGGVTTGIWSLVEEGFVSGQGPEDYVLRKQLEATGWQANSLKINGKWYKYDRTDPVGTMLGTVANAVDVVKYSESDRDAAEVTGAAIGGILENYANKTYLASVADVFALVKSQHKATDIQKMSTRIATGFMPYSSALSSLRRADDKYLRDTRVKGDYWTSLVNSFKNKIPGYSQDLPARIGWNGEPQVMMGGAVWRGMSPIQIGVAQGDPASFELVDNGVPVRNPTHNLKLPMGVNFDLYKVDDGKGLVYQQYQLLVGKARHKAVTQLMKEREYKNATAGVDSERTTGLRNAVNAGTLLGKQSFFEWYNKSRKKYDWPSIDERSLMRAVKSPKGDVNKAFKIKRTQEGLVPEYNRPKL